MKILLPLGLVAVLCFSFNGNTSRLTLEQAAQEKKVVFEIVPLGGYRGNCISIRVQNLGGALNLELPVGTIFIPEDSTEQTLITTSPQLFALGRKEEKLIQVNAFCTEANDHSPSKESKFSMGRSQNKALLGLTSFLDSLRLVDEDAIQNSVWCVTDHESVSNVYLDNANTQKALRGYLCKTTGQKDTWYSTRSDLHVNQNREIVRTPKEIKGDIEYTSTERSELQGVVKDSTGKILVTNPNKTVVPAGHVKFEFNLRIEGWPHGNYSVVYTNNGKEVINQPFSF